MSIPPPLRSISVLCLFLALFQSCREGHTSKQETAADAPAASLPSIPDSTMQRLWNECDYIDFVFYNLPFSISQEKQPDIRSTLQHISSKPAGIRADCQPLGRLFFQIEGENIVQADIFFSPDCRYFIFYEDGNPTYANVMTPAGIQFYQRVLEMAQKSTNAPG